MPPADQYETGEYWEKNPGYHLEYADFKARHIMRALEGRELGPAVRVCDVGCGPGGVLHHLGLLLGEKGLTVAAADGYDISAAAVAQGRALFPDLDLRVGGAAEVPAGYDILLVMDVMEHVENYYELLRNLSGKARFYVFHLPMELCALRALHQSELRMSWEGWGHIHQFCRTTALQVLKVAGFEPLGQHWTDMDRQYRRTRSAHGLKRNLLYAARRVLFPLAPSFSVALLAGKELMVLAKDQE